MTDAPDRIAVVTGASRGIGRACAEALTRGGWSVAIGYRSSEADAKETVSALEQLGRPGLAVHMDVTDEASVTEAFRRVGDELGPVTGPSSSPTRRKASVTDASSVTSIATARPGRPS